MPGSWGREIGEMLPGTGIAGGSLKRRPWLRMGCCANDDDDDDTLSVELSWTPHHDKTRIRVASFHPNGVMGLDLNGNVIRRC